MQTTELTHILDSQLSWLDGVTGEMSQKLIEICDMNSGTLNVHGVEAVADVLISWFAEFDADLNRIDIPAWQTIDSHGRINEFPLGTILHWTKRPNAARKVILNIHRDTVYAVDSSFQKCRMLDERTLNGPGVSDAKGGIVVMLYALKAFERSSVAEQIGWEVIINPDEELGSPSSAEFLISRAPHADIGLLFEPAYADGTMVTWRKGSGNFVFLVRGKSAHAGREFAAGRNAIVAMCRAMNMVNELNGQLEDVTINVGRVEGGGALNVVPDLAIGRVNARVKTTEQAQWIDREFKRICESVNQLDGITCELHGSFTSPPKVIDPETESLIRRIEHCGQLLDIEIKWQGTGGASDGNKFTAAGLPNIDTLGPVGGDIHSSNEFVFVDTLAARAKLAALVLVDFAISANAV